MVLNSSLERTESAVIFSSNRFIKPCHVPINRGVVVKGLLQEIDLLYLVGLEIVQINARTTKDLHVQVGSLDDDLSLFAIDTPVYSRRVLELKSTADGETEDCAGCELAMNQDLIVGSLLDGLGYRAIRVNNVDSWTLDRKE